MTRLILFNLLLFGTCGYALLRGTRDARLVAMVCLVAAFASYPMASFYRGIETSVLVIDVLVLLAFVYVALTSSRFWPLWISGLQLTASLGHVIKALQSDLVPIAYAVALRYWSYPELLILALAVWRSQKRARIVVEPRTV
ncbi:MAG: hypothetical protein ABIR63_01505 [Sphingomicrobium sp.]